MLNKQDLRSLTRNGSNSSLTGDVCWNSESKYGDDSMLTHTSLNYALKFYTIFHIYRMRLFFSIGRLTHFTLSVAVIGIVNNIKSNQSLLHSRSDICKVELTMTDSPRFEAKLRTAL